MKIAIGFLIGVYVAQHVAPDVEAWRWAALFALTWLAGHLFRLLTNWLGERGYHV